MGKGTKVVAHEDTDTGTGNFYKCEYGDGYCSTLPIAIPKHVNHFKKLFTWL